LEAVNGLKIHPMQIAHQTAVQVQRGKLIIPQFTGSGVFIDIERAAEPGIISKGKCAHQSVDGWGMAFRHLPRGGREYQPSVLLALTQYPSWEEENPR